MAVFESFFISPLEVSLDVAFHTFSIYRGHADRGSVRIDLSRPILAFHSGSRRRLAGRPIYLLDRAILGRLPLAILPGRRRLAVECACRSRQVFQFRIDSTYLFRGDNAWQRL